ncbi:hypothetical protein PybrP1_009420 [[Pythium] brassicae (nom. inval.)]|nr:hypothetical protein PybrP1_009420 [[Pythium] brassicae (nom. inval.)]
MWTSSTQERGLRGARCVDERVTGGRQNMRVIACINATGLIYYKNRFGVNRAVDASAFFARLLRAICDEQEEPLNSTVFVLDNTLASSESSRRTRT